MLVISELMPKLQEFQVSHKSNPTGAILDYLGYISLKHILPTPPPLNPRRFIVSYLIFVIYRYTTDRSDFSVVRVVPCVAFIIDMGRDLRARYDTTWDLELD